MRMLKVLFVLSALTLGASSAWSGEMSFGLTGGAAFPFGDYGDAVNTGFEGGVFGDYWLKPTYAFGADIIGNFHGSNEDFFGPGTTTDVSTTVIQFGLHGRWMPAMQSNLHPWLQYGAAMYNMQSEGDVTSTLGTAEVDESSTDFGINGGAGLNLWSNASMNLGVGGMYHYVFTEDDATSYANLGLYLTFLTGGTTMAGGQ